MTVLALVIPPDSLPAVSSKDMMSGLGQLYPAIVKTKKSPL